MRASSSRACSTDREWLATQWRRRGILATNEDLEHAISRLAPSSWFVRRNKSAFHKPTATKHKSPTQTIRRPARHSIASLSLDSSDPPPAPTPSRLRSLIESGLPTPNLVAQSSSSSALQRDGVGRHDGSTDVYLTIYSINGCWNACFHPLGLGAYHSGVEIGGLEYIYDGRASVDGRGVSWRMPYHHDEAFLVQMPLLARLRLGSSEYSAVESHQRLRVLADCDWKAHEYHFLEYNCNHWCTAAARELGLHEPPPWLNRLASLLAFCSGAPIGDRFADVPASPVPKTPKSARRGIWTSSPRGSFAIRRQSVASSEASRVMPSRFGSMASEVDLESEPLLTDVKG